jgi:hypothetical protein
MEGSEHRADNLPVLRVILWIAFKLHHQDLVRVEQKDLCDRARDVLEGCDLLLSLDLERVAVGAVDGHKPQRFDQGGPKRPGADLPAESRNWSRVEASTRKQRITPRAWRSSGGPVTS